MLILGRVLASSPARACGRLCASRQETARGRRSARTGRRARSRTGRRWPRSPTRIRKQELPSKSVARMRPQDRAGGSRLPPFAGLRQSLGGLVLSPPAAACRRMRPDRSLSVPPTLGLIVLSHLLAARIGPTGNKSLQLLRCATGQPRSWPSLLRAAITLGDVLARHDVPAARWLR